MAVFGVDISENNGSVDFAALNGSGVKFALIRCGYGDNIASQDANAEYLLGKLYLRGEDVPKDLARATAYLNAAVAHGNEYAQYLLNSLNRTPEPQNWSVTSSALTLMRQTASIFQDRFRDLDTQYAHHIDRKLMSKIAEKKLAQGQKLGG